MDLKTWITQKLGSQDFIIFWDEESYQFLSSLSQSSSDCIFCNKQTQTVYTIVFNANTIMIIKHKDSDFDQISTWNNFKITPTSYYQISRYFKIGKQWLDVTVEVNYILIFDVNDNDTPLYYINHGILLERPTDCSDIQDLRIWI